MLSVGSYFGIRVSTTLATQNICRTFPESDHGLVSPHGDIGKTCHRCAMDLLGPCGIQNVFFHKLFSQKCFAKINLFYVSSFSVSFLHFLCTC